MQEFVIEKDVLVKYNGNSEVVIIPEEVKTIARDCFRDNKAVKKIFLPQKDDFVTLESNAFAGCDLEFIRGNYFSCEGITIYPVKHLYGNRIYIPDYFKLPGCKVHCKHSKELWETCRKNNIQWVPDWERIVAKEKDTLARERMPILTEELKKTPQSPLLQYLFEQMR